MHLIRFFVLLTFLLFVISCDNTSHDPYPIQRSGVFKHAAIVSAHPLASEIGKDILKIGGNAVDAAVATQFALSVVYPRAGNIGGGGFMVIRLPNGDSFSLDYREKAPLTADRDMYLNEEGIIYDSLSRYGNLAVGVPGSVDGLIKAWERFGKLKDFSLILRPSIQLAEDGYRINRDEAERLENYKKDLKKYNRNEIPFVKNESWQTRDLIVQKDLAKTLSSILKKGRDGFYDGWVAEKIDSQMRANGALLRKEDLSLYNSVWREPTIASYKNFKMISMPPPSSGGIALGQLLKLAEQQKLSDLKLNGKKYIHLLAEMERRVYADRARYLGDIDFYPVPDSILMDSLYIHGRFDDFNPLLASKSNSIQGGEIEINLESFETTHTSVIDQAGMAVSVTTTLNSNYGSKVMLDGAGFFLNNEMDDFSVKAGVANQFGLVGGKANEIEGEKRMLSSMTPTIFEKDGELFMILGSPGGSTIITSVFQVFLNVVEHGLSMSDAISLPRFHHQCLPDQIIVEEDRFNKDLLESLSKMGHEIDSYKKIGLVKGILIKGDGKIEAAGDDRSFDDVEGL